MGIYVGDNLVAGNVGEVYTKAQVDTMIANAVALAEPTGSIKPFAGTTIPDGYLLCDGSAVSRTTYAALFAVIGTTYGSGDGSTTFNLPNLSDGRVAAGTGFRQYVGTTTNGQLPNIKGDLPNTAINYAGWSGVNGAFNITSFSAYASVGNITGSKITFDASRSSQVYSDYATTVRAASLFVPYIIKY